MARIKIKNLSSEINRRIRLIKTPTSVVDIGQQQGAVVNQSDYVGICLAPLEVPVISCEGAESWIRFPWFSGNWNIELDGVLYQTNGDSVPYYIQENFGDILNVGNDGFMNIFNIDVVPHRFRFIPLSETGYTQPTNNPTFIEHEDGSLTFCLSPQPNQISCDGATSTLFFAHLEGDWEFGSFDNSGNPISYVTGNPDTIRVWVGEHLSNKVVINNDGYFRLTSTTNEDTGRYYLRYSSPDASATDPVENPTVQFNPETNTFTFCLAPKGNQISCEGATPTADTGGIWGNVTMMVNGTPYDGIWSIPDVMNVDNNGEELHNTFKNRSDQYLRVHITSTELNQNDHGWNENQNPTLGVDFDAGTIEFCLAPAGCEPTEFTMVDNNLFEGGSVRLDYIIDAPNQGINNVSNRYSMTDIAQGTWLSEIMRDVIAQIKSDHLFISFKEGIGNEVANFSFSTYRSTIIGQFYLLGAPDEISSDPITIKFVKNGFVDDLFPLLFPDAAADGITEYSAHSCGTMDWPGI